MMPPRTGTVEVAPTAGGRLVVEFILHSDWRGRPGTRSGGNAAPAPVTLVNCLSCGVGVFQFGIEWNDLALHSGAALSLCWWPFKRFDIFSSHESHSLSADLMN